MSQPYFPFTVDHIELLHNNASFTMTVLYLQVPSRTPVEHNTY